MSDRPSSPTPRRALLIAAHGSADDPRCAEPAFRHAEAIAARGIYDEVRCIFWKQAPYFAEAFDVTAAAELVVVPLMTADGWYATTVLPREVGAASARMKSSRRVHIGPAVGVDPRMADLLLEQAVAAASGCAGLAPGAPFHLLVIGHGTRRDPQRSGASTWAAARALTGRAPLLSVGAGFLEQDPGVTAAFDAVPGEEPVVIVPNLVANGGHAVDDVPAALGLPAGARAGRVGERLVIFADAVGEHPAIADLIVDSARRAVRERRCA